MNARQVDRDVWRSLALLILVVGIVGTGTELILLEHTEEIPQRAPLVALTVGLLAALWVGRSHTRRAVLTLRAVMFLYLPVSAAGIYFHLKSNMEFEFELNPAVGGMKLVTEVLHGAMPALAPGAMAQLGLIGLLVCFRHPALAE